MLHYSLEQILDLHHNVSVIGHRQTESHVVVLTVETPVRHAVGDQGVVLVVYTQHVGVNPALDVHIEPHIRRKAADFEVVTFLGDHREVGPVHVFATTTPRDMGSWKPDPDLFAIVKMQVFLGHDVSDVEHLSAASERPNTSPGAFGPLIHKVAWRLSLVFLIQSAAQYLHFAPPVDEVNVFVVPVFLQLVVAEHGRPVLLQAATRHEISQQLDGLGVQDMVEIQIGPEHIELTTALSEREHHEHSSLELILDFLFVLVHGFVLIDHSSVGIASNHRL